MPINTHYCKDDCHPSSDEWRTQRGEQRIQA
jgi:hypothetical protein